MSPETPALESTLPLVGAEPLWSEATRVFDVPAGDSFGVLVVNFTEADASEFFGGDAYMLGIDREGLGESGYAHISAHFIEGNESSWSVATGGIGGRAAVGGTTDDGGPPRILFLIAMHAETAATLDVGAWLDDDKMPSARIPGTWLASGPAQISFIHAFSGLGGISKNSHGVDEGGKGIPFGTLVAAGDISVAADHPGTGASFEFSSSILGPFSVGAGIVDISWTSGDEVVVGSTPYLAPARIASHVATGPATNGTATSLRLRGADALTFLMMDHVSVPFDIATVGLHQEPVAYLPDGQLPLAQGACLVASPRARCA